MSQRCLYGVPLWTKIRTKIFQSKPTVFAVGVEYFEFEVEYIKIEVEFLKIEVENMKFEVERKCENHNRKETEVIEVDKQIPERKLIWETQNRKRVRNLGMIRWWGDYLRLESVKFVFCLKVYAKLNVQ